MLSSFRSKGMYKEIEGELTTHHWPTSIPGTLYAASFFGSINKQGEGILCVISETKELFELKDWVDKQIELRDVRPDNLLETAFKD